jgi:hypothetical protein
MGEMRPDRWPRKCERTEVMRKNIGRLMRRMGIALAGSLLLVIGNCDLQHPPSNADTVVGIAIAPG